MNRITLPGIIALMSLALVGLIVFQLYWIESVIGANEERFKQDVISAMHSVSENLEKQEAYQVLRNQKWPAQSSNGNYSPVYNQNINGNSNQNRSNASIDSSMTSGELSFYFSITQEGNFQLSNGGGPAQVQQQYEINDPRLAQDLQKVSNKSNMMVTILQELIFNRPPPQSRLRPDQLDSLLQFELKERGIDIDYNFGVISPYQNRFVYVEKPNGAKDLAQSEFRASLFPNDLTGEYQMLVLDFPGKSEFLRSKLWLTTASSGLLMLIIMFCFAYAVKTILRQKKLSEMKSDFINNMTHELKTPIATVGLAVEALSDKEVMNVNDTYDRYLGMIGEENKRLGQHVEKVLQMAAIEKKDIVMKKDMLDVHDLIDDAANRISLQIEKREGAIKMILNAKNAWVEGDPVHLMNVVMNLLDNANKYSPEVPNIIIRTESSGSNLVLSIQDHGLGMTKEATRQIFQKFYRVSTGNVHDVKGFGLGLAYVKSVVEQHGGLISVQSELGRGSKFFISLPTK